jgi:hypothetical protein
MTRTGAFYKSIKRLKMLRLRIRRIFFSNRSNETVHDASTHRKDVLIAGDGAYLLCNRRQDITFTG